MYLHDALRDAVTGRRKGYVFIAGAPGTGKSTFLRSLAAEADAHLAPVLSFTAGHTPEIESFDLLMQLAAQIRARWGYESPELQNHALELDDYVRTELTDLLHGATRAAKLPFLLIAIDGLDDPRARDTETQLIAADLPAAHRLPDGCFIVIATGASPDASLRQELHRLRTTAEPYPGDTSGPALVCETVRIAPTSDENHDLIRAYLGEALPEPLRTKDDIERVLARSGGNMLFAALAARALHDGLFASTEEIPAAEAFYAGYLERLGARTGDALPTVDLPLLALLAVAVEPVTAAQLDEWGIPIAALPAVLARLHDLVAVEPGGVDGAARYAIAHATLAKHLETAQPREFYKAHAAIAGALIGWLDSGMQAEPDPYALLYAYEHAYASGDESLAADLDERAVDQGLGCLCATDALVLAGEHRRALPLFILAFDLLTVPPDEERDALFVARGEALRGQAECYEALGNFTAAAATLELQTFPADRGLAATLDGRDVELTLRHIAVLEKSGEQHQRVGELYPAEVDWGAAAVRYEALRARGERIDAEKLVRARLTAGLVAHQAGDEDRSMAHLDMAIAVAEQDRSVPRTLLALLHAERAGVLATTERYDEALAALDTGLGILATAPDDPPLPRPRVTATTLALKGRVFGLTQRGEESLAALARSVAVAQSPEFGTEADDRRTLLAVLQGYAGALDQAGRAAEARETVAAAIVVATGLVEAAPGLGEIANLQLTWNLQAEILRRQGDRQALAQSLLAAAAAMRDLAERGLYGALNLWIADEVAVAEYHLEGGAYAEATARINFATQLFDQLEAQAEGAAPAAGKLDLDRVHAAILAGQGRDQQALLLIDRALEVYTTATGLDVVSAVPQLRLALDFKASLLDALGRQAEARAVRRRAATAGSLPNQLVAPGVRLIRGIGTASISALDDEDIPQAVTLLDHQAIASLRAGFRGWSGANWLSPDRVLHVRSAGRDRPVELTFQGITGEVRYTLTDEQSHAFRDTIGELYDEGRVR